MKHQSLFSEKNKKNILKCCLLKFLHSMLIFDKSLRITSHHSKQSFFLIDYILSFTFKYMIMN